MREKEKQAFHSYGWIWDWKSSFTEPNSRNKRKNKAHFSFLASSFIQEILGKPYTNQCFFFFLGCFSVFFRYCPSLSSDVMGLPSGEVGESPHKGESREGETRSGGSAGKTRDFGVSVFYGFCVVFANVFSRTFLRFFFLFLRFPRYSFLFFFLGLFRGFPGFSGWGVLYLWP